MSLGWERGLWGVFCGNNVIQSLTNQVEFAQDNIQECQTNIVQVEEAKVYLDFCLCLKANIVFCVCVFLGCAFLNIEPI